MRTRMTTVKHVLMGLCLILFGPTMTSVFAWMSYGGSRFIWAPFPARYTKEANHGTAGFLSIEHLKEGSCILKDSNGTEHAMSLHGEQNVTQYTIPHVQFLTFDIHVERLAMELICSTDVNLNFLNQEVSEEFADAYPIMPVAALSNRYIVPPVPNNAILEIVAAYDTTTVRVYFNSNCKYSKEGISYNSGEMLITILRKGQVLQLTNVYPSFRKMCTLGGTVVESIFPVALFSGSSALSYPQAFKDAIMSQIPPTGSSGTSFIIPKILNIGSYRVNIVAERNYTSVVRETRTGTKYIQLNETDFHFEDFSDSDFEIIYIKSSKPISVFLIAGNNGKHSIFSSKVPSEGDYGTEFLVSDIQTSQVKYVRYITLITSPNCTSEIGVNTIWTTSSTTSHIASVSSFRAPSNMTVIKSTDSTCPFAVLVTGLGFSKMYGYFSSPAGYHYVPLTDVNLLNSTAKTLSLADSDAITLVCETNPTRPPSAVTWIKDNLTLTQAVTSHNTDGQGLTVSTSVLTLSSSCSDQLSEVSCVASYNSTTLTSPVLKLLEQCTNVPLTTVSILNDTTSPLPVDENDVISLVCETNPTRPPSTIFWNIGNDIVMQTRTSHIVDGHGTTVSSSVLSLTVACSHHFSEISCTASNNASNLTSPRLKMFVQCPKDQETIIAASRYVPATYSGRITEMSDALGHSGTRFIWAFFPTDTHGYDGEVDGYLFIEHNEEGNCTLSDSYGRSADIILEGEKTVTPAYLVQYLLFIGTHVEKLGLELICSTEVNLDFLNHAKSLRLFDVFPVAPVQALSTKYILPSMPNSALMEVVADTDITTVKVYFKTNCIYSYLGYEYKNGDVLSVILRKQQLLEITTTRAYDCDLGGTVVESDFPVAVLSGANVLTYPVNVVDAALSQVPPVVTWGSSYIITWIAGVAQYKINVLAAYNDTLVTRESRTEVNSFVINERETYSEEFLSSELEVIYIKSSRPTLVSIIAGDASQRGSFSAMVPSTDAYGTEYIVPDIYTTVPNPRSVTLITRDNCTADIDINANWTTVATASQTVSISSFQAPPKKLVIRSISTTCPFAVLLTGSLVSRMYGYFNSPVRNNNYVPLTFVTILNATTNPLSARENDVITLVCETNPTLPASAITWMKDNETLTDAVSSYTTARGKTVTRSILTLRVTCIDHMPNISCTASINDSSLTSPRLKMSVLCDNVPLNNLTFINFTSSPLSVKEGDVISFTCKTNPTRPPSTMNWMMIHMPSLQLTTSQTTDVRGRTVSTTVVTLNVTCSNDMPELYCTASNNGTRMASLSQKLLVQCSNVSLTNVTLYHVSTNAQRPIGSENGLVVTGANPLAVDEGDVVRLMCETNPTRPPSTMSWTMDNQNLTQVETYDTLDVLGRTVTTSILTLNVVCSDTMPEIYCTASYDDPIVTSNLTLDVRCRNALVTSVRILNDTNKTLSVTDNDTITLVCETNPTRPPSNIIWMLDHKALSTQPVTSQRHHFGKTVATSILTLSPRCSDYLQVITCIASNNVSRMSSLAMTMAAQCSNSLSNATITSVRVLNATTNPLSITDNDTITLVCETNPTRPPSNIIWMLDHKALSTQPVTSQRHHFGKTVATSILTLSPRCSDYLQVITCIASNNVSRRSSPIMKMAVSCNVPLKTVTIKGTTTNVLLVGDKEKVRLQCETNPTSQKSSLTWKKDNETVTQEVEYYTKNVGRLTITSSILTLIATCDDNLSPVSCAASYENTTLTSSELTMIVNCPNTMESSNSFRVGVGVGVGAVGGLLLLVAVSVFIIRRLRSKSHKDMPNVSNGSASSYMTKHNTPAYDNQLLARSQESVRNNTNTEMNTFHL